MGILDPLRRYIVDTAEPLTSTNSSVLNYVNLFLGIQTFLLQYPHTRSFRFAVGVAGLLFLCQTWSKVRFVEPWFDAINNGLAVGFMHNAFKLLEFALIVDPVRVPDHEQRNILWRIVSAVDVAINSRWLGLRPVQYDISKPIPVVRSSHSYGRSIVRHACKFIYGYTVIDTLVTLLRQLGWDTVGRSDPPAAALERFTHTGFTLLPSTFDFNAPSWLVLSFTKLLVGIVVWHTLFAGYHFFALVFIVPRVNAPDEWDTELFEKPWNQDSLLTFWAKGWHQLFKHHFVLVSTLTLTALHLNPRGILVVPIVFFLSGAMHGVAHISMTNPPHPIRVASFFWWSGLGCTLEVVFRRITGRRVKGILGRVWMWTFLALTSYAALDAELQSGIGGTKVSPPGIDRIGPFLVPFIRRHLVDRADRLSGF